VEKGGNVPITHNVWGDPQYVLPGKVQNDGAVKVSQKLIAGACSVTVTDDADTVQTSFSQGGPGMKIKGSYPESVKFVPYPAQYDKYPWPALGEADVTLRNGTEIYYYTAPNNTFVVVIRPGHKPQTENCQPA